MATAAGTQAMSYGTSPMRKAVRRFVRRRVSLAGLIVFAIVCSAAIGAPFLTPHSPNAIVGERYEEPLTKSFLLGTDNIGRDVFARLVYGARVSLVVGFLAQGLASAIGIAMGLTAGWYRGFAERFIMRIVDIFMSFPFILLAILIVASVGPSLWNVILALGLTGWTGMCRIVRAQTLTIRELPYIEAARAIGVGSHKIMARHILPNILGSVIIVATVGVAGAILAEASLSFLGLGISPPTPSWGVMLANGRLAVFTQPHLVVAPALAIFVTVLALNQAGDGLRDALDPRSIETVS